MPRFEVYVGKKRTDESAKDAFEHQTGPAAVIRNLKVVLDGNKSGFHIVCIDRFYSAVNLCIALLTMQIYAIGTVMTNRIGYDKGVIDKRKKRPKDVPRGGFKVSRSIDMPLCMAVSWMDAKPVHFLSTGAIATPATVSRREKHGPASDVRCPKVVSDYHKMMGGVDVHDQLRLQRYSIQLAVRFRKYYKTLFLGLVDMAIVNAFITHREHMRMLGKKEMLRADFMSLLQNQLLQVNESHFQDVPDIFSPSTIHPPRKQFDDEHQLTQLNDWIASGTSQKRRQRACKICALHRGDKKKSFQTTYYCNACSQKDARVFLCNKSRHKIDGVDKTCFQIWHENYELGKKIPPELDHKVIFRRSKQSPEQRKKTRRELVQDDFSREGYYECV